MASFHSAGPLILLLSLCLGVFSDHIHVPLSRRSRGSTVDAHAEAYKAKVKYGHIEPNSLAAESSRKARRASNALGRRATGTNSNVTIPVVNEGGAGVLASVQIGTPPQTFSLVLDTGSADLWVAGIDCTNCARSQHLFNFKNSSSFVIPTADLNKRVDIKYGQGNVSGVFATEDISMGQFVLDNQSFGDFAVAGQRFVSVDDMSPDLAESATQGIVGLGFTGLSVTGSTPFFENLASSSDELTSPEFSFWIQRTNPQSPNELDPGGVFTIGGSNSSFFTGDIEFLDVLTAPGFTDPTFWFLSVAKISVNGEDIPINTAGAAGLAAIDTGTTLLGAPSDAAAAFWKVAGGKPLDDGSGLFEIPCNSQIKVTISFGGKTWAIDPQDMIFSQVSEGSAMCTGAIFDVQAGTDIQDAPQSGNPAWIIGDTFLKNVYSVFRVQPPSIGFAQLSDFALAGAPDQSSGNHASPGGSAKGNGGPKKPMSLNPVLCASLVLVAITMSF